MKKILICFALIFLLPLSAAADENWERVFSDKSGIYYIEKTTVLPRLDNKGLYANVWSRQVPSIAFIDSVVGKSSQENKIKTYNIGEIISHFEIRPSTWEYCVLKRIIYDKNNKVMYVYNEKSSWKRFKPNTAIDAIARKAVVISVQKAVVANKAKKTL